MTPITQEYLHAWGVMSRAIELAGAVAACALLVLL